MRIAAASALAAAIVLGSPAAHANDVCYTDSCSSCSPGGGHRSTLIPATAFPAVPEAEGVITIAFVDPNDGTPRRFVVSQQGRIYVWNGLKILPTPFLDIASRVLYTAGGERGLLAMAVAPDYATSGRFFLYYTGEGAAPGNDGDIVVERYQRSATNPDLADPTPTTVLTIPHTSASNHNGGWLAFSPKDGYLYISTGDGGGGCDSTGPHGQSVSTLLGKVLRIDVNATSGGDCAASTHYGIPAGNPFVGVSGCDEIWDYGVRNPFRFSFDRGAAGTGTGKGDLWLGDVGQGNFEEVNYHAASRAAPLNFGWVLREGCRGSNTGTSMCGGGSSDDTESCQYPLDDALAGSLYDPVLCHSAGAGWHSVMGGYRYRGAHVPDLAARYLYSDNNCGPLWASTAISGVTAGTTASCWLQGSPGVYAFAEDQLGELYVVTGYHHTVDCITAGNGCPWAGVPFYQEDFESAGLTRWSGHTPP